MSESREMRLSLIGDLIIEMSHADPEISPTSTLPVIVHPRSVLRTVAADKSECGKEGGGAVHPSIIYIHSIAIQCKVLPKLILRSNPPSHLS